MLLARATFNYCGKRSNALSVIENGGKLRRWSPAKTHQHDQHRESVTWHIPSFGIKKINKQVFCTRQLDVTAHGVAAHSSNRCLNLPRYDVNLASNNNDHPNKLPRLGRQRVAWGDALSMTYEAPAWLTCEKKKKKKSQRVVGVEPRVLAEGGGCPLYAKCHGTVQSSSASRGVRGGSESSKRRPLPPSDHTRRRSSVFTAVRHLRCVRRTIYATSCEPECPAGRFLHAECPRVCVCVSMCV